MIDWECIGIVDAFVDYRMHRIDVRKGTKIQNGMKNSLPSVFFYPCIHWFITSQNRWLKLPPLKQIGEPTYNIDRRAIIDRCDRVSMVSERISEFFLCFFRRILSNKRFTFAYVEDGNERTSSFNCI